MEGIVDTLPTTPEEHRIWWQEAHPDIEYGSCVCGCGQPTKIQAKSNRRIYAVANCPARFLLGHHAAESNRARADRLEDNYYVDDNGCWIWIKGTDWEGYALIKRNRRTTKAHRFYYIQFVGPIPDGLQLDHTCKVRNCVNPEHQDPVTPLENARRSAKPKLDVAKAKEIKTLIAKGVTQKEIAEFYGVHAATVNHISRGRTWKDA